MQVIKSQALEVWLTVYDTWYYTVNAPIHFRLSHMIWSVGYAATQM